jgi:anti-sigma B factor antagonist
MPQEFVPAVTVRDDWDHGAAIVTVSGDIDLSSVDVLTQCLDHVVARKPHRLIIDLAQVGFIDTSGVHAITQAYGALSPDSPVILRSPQRQVQRIFQLTGLAELIAIEDTVQPDGDASPP